MEKTEVEKLLDDHADKRSLIVFNYSQGWVSSEDAQKQQDELLKDTASKLVTKEEADKPAMSLEGLLAETKHECSPSRETWEAAEEVWKDYNSN